MTGQNLSSFRVLERKPFCCLYHVVNYVVATAQRPGANLVTAAYGTRDVLQRVVHCSQRLRHRCSEDSTLYIVAGQNTSFQKRYHTTRVKFIRPNVGVIEYNENGHAKPKSRKPQSFPLVSPPATASPKLRRGCYNGSNLQLLN